ncbi:hypothetical protein [Nocardia stercoris]|uniref:hypothetical protein n=1 Tax=Nocardia stercoris TaxID=2483361 RepID=UPI001F31ED19|nr:hypothetical protein [Nocardia stercoris]
MSATSPSVSPPLSAVRSDRRALLRAAGTVVVAAGGTAAVAALSACAPPPPPPVDVLLGPEQDARTDAVWAQSAIATAPDHSAALTLIATQRTAHADALRAEIDRARGTYGDGTLPKSSTPPVDPPAAPAPPPTPAAVRAQLTKSQQSAADLAQGQNGFRAGLLASISAACAAHAGVLLA